MVGIYKINQIHSDLSVQLLRLYKASHSHIQKNRLFRTKKNVFIYFSTIERLSFYIWYKTYAK